MDVDELKKAVDDGSVDTVMLVIADMEGRLQGKRLTGPYFLDEVLEHGAEGCNYLLAVDVEMNTVAGYAMSSWERGYGDFEMKPDLDTLRPIPWHPASVLLMADLAWADGKDVVASPRQILRRQLARLEERGLVANAGTELEFMVFKDTYEEAWHKGYRDLEPANLYNNDYSMLGGARVEPLLRRIRNEMAAAGMTRRELEGRVQPRSARDQLPLRRTRFGVADDHAIYKNGAKEIAAQEGYAITYMAKFDEREGSSCHIHCSLGNDEGRQRLRRGPADVRPLRRGPACRAARADALLRAAHQLVQALRGGLVRAHGRRVGQRQPHVLDARRRPRRGAARRKPAARRGREPVPRAGGDDRRGAGAASTRSSRSSRPMEGNAYTSDKQHVPQNLYDARDLFAGSELAREAFGQEVVDHYLNRAQIELTAFEATVTDWEHFRGFERL